MGCLRHWFGIFGDLWSDCVGSSHCIHFWSFHVPCSCAVCRISRRQGRGSSSSPTEQCRGFVIESSRTGLLKRTCWRHAFLMHACRLHALSLHVAGCLWFCVFFSLCEHFVMPQVVR